MSTDQSKVTAPETEHKGIGRRSVVAKGAAVGAIAWTTPIIASSSASATTTGTCTPKCFPTPFQNNLVFYLVRYCPGSGQKQVFIYADVTGVGAQSICPCDGNSEDPTTPTSVSVTGTSFKLKNQNLSSVNLTYDVPGVGVREGFHLYNSINGALGDGALTGCVRVVVECKDRTGDSTYRYCDMRVTFDSTPADGNCGSRQQAQTGEPTNVTCSTTCNDPSPIAACP